MIVYSPEALDDLRSAIGYLARRNPQAAQALQEAVERLALQLEARQFEGHAGELKSGKTVRSWPLLSDEGR